MDEYLRLIEEENQSVQRTKLKRYQPYAKQREFHAAGAVHRERLLMAANQVGKTWAGAAEAAIHLTGVYPKWWKGKIWKRPVHAWAGGETYLETRRTVQKLLVGPPEIESEWGTGLIPGDRLKDWTRHQGLANAIESITVQHESGDFSTLGFKSYDQGRKNWQGASLDFVWFDEEPPLDVYIEGLTRTNATGGIVWLTFTPLLGMSAVVDGFRQECPW